MPLIPEEQTAPAPHPNRKARRLARRPMQRRVVGEADSEDSLISQTGQRIAASLAGLMLRPPPAPQRAALSVQELADRYGLSRSSIYRLAKRDLLRLTKVGSRTVILASDEAKMVAKLEGSR